MSLELAGIALDQLVHIEVRQRAGFVHHRVPGASGDFTQDLGRPSVVVAFQGIFYGADAGDQLKQLRDKYLAREPVDFLAEAVGEGYFAQVVIERLQVAQRAGWVDQFDYVCEVVEYVPPPPPASANLLGELDTGLLDEAAGLMDDIQSAIGQVADLANLLAGAASFADPTARLPGMLTSFTDAAGSAPGALDAIARLL